LEPPEDRDSQLVSGNALAEHFPGLPGLEEERASRTSSSRGEKRKRRYPNYRPCLVDNFRKRLHSVHVCRRPGEQPSSGRDPQFECDRPARGSPPFPFSYPLG